MRVSLQMFALVLLGCMVDVTMCHGQAEAPEARALARRDYGLARDLARARIETGAHTAQELLPIYKVLAVASAKLLDLETAQRAFIAVLAFDPAFRLEADATAEVRSPYMEARGFWSEHERALSATVRTAEPQRVLEVIVDDPAHLSVRVLLRARASKRERFAEMVQPTAPKLAFPVAWKVRGDLEYELALLDEHGNRLWQSDPPSQPTGGANVALDGPSQAPKQLRVAPVERRSRRPYYVAGGLLLTAGAGALAGGLIAHLEREKLAQDWNSFRCDGEGATRGAVCADEKQRISRLTQVATGLYAAGAAALLSGVVVFLIGARKGQPDRQHALRCTSGPGELGMGCSLAF